jgi:hypothetical protein
LAVVTNWATSLPIPESWVWLKSPTVLWSGVVVLALLGCGFAVRALRAPIADTPGAAQSVVSSGAGSVMSGSGAAVGSVTAEPGAVVIVGAQGAVSVAVPAAPPTARPGQLVIGELPGPPPALRERGELAELDRVWASGERVAVVCSLTGARGVGKSQVAAAYARRQAERGCPLVAWVNAETDDECLAGLAGVARARGR